jgi:hypothetical protein
MLGKVQTVGNTLCALKYEQEDTISTLLSKVT